MKLIKLSSDHYIIMDESKKDIYTVPLSEVKELFTEDDVRKAIVMSATSPTDNLIDRCDEIIKHIKQSKK